jgi:hypothetical protein
MKYKLHHYKCIRRSYNYILYFYITFTKYCIFCFYFWIKSVKARNLCLQSWNDLMADFRLSLEIVSLTQEYMNILQWTYFDYYCSATDEAVFMRILFSVMNICNDI